MYENRMFHNGGQKSFGFYLGVWVRLGGGWIVVKLQVSYFSGKAELHPLTNNVLMIQINTTSRDYLGCLSLKPFNFVHPPWKMVKG